MTAVNPRETSPTLLDRLRQPGDTAAWARFEATYGELIVAFARRRGLQATDADDIRQMVMLKLMSSLKQFEYQRERGRFRDYLLRVTLSAIADWAPKQASRHAAESDSTPAKDTQQAGGNGGPSAIEQAWQQEWEAFHFRRAWSVVQSQFSAQHLEAFDRLLAGEPIRHVADHFNMSEDAVHKVKQRVRDRLKLQIASQVAEEDGV